MNVQKDTREDTAISQDAPYFLDAIRNGARPTNTGFAGGLDFLTNYVQSVYFVSNYVTGNRNAAVVISNTAWNPPFSGAEIIGLLSTPEPGSATLTNYVYNRAIVRSLGGAATEQNGSNSLMAFRYQMDVEVVPFNSIAPDTVDFNNYPVPWNALGLESNDYVIRSNRWRETTVINGQPGTGALTYNLFDVRLHFSWPVLPNGSVGPGRQTYRTLIASQLIPTTVTGPRGIVPVWYFQPQYYTNNIYNNNLNPTQQ